MKIWKSSLRVRSYELDSFGHVNNGTFAKYLEKARGDYLREAGMRFDDFHRWGKFPVIAHVSIDYKAPAFFDEALHILAKAGRVGTSSITLKYRIEKDDGTLCAEAETVMVFVDPRGEPVPMPEPMRTAFSAKK
ncbi:MAG: thioesterase family protein [Candidatus Marinimicrobia bacterium]|nr:thioesterase family protein [Candidatus Neomarinimicrobiota bacterium]